LHLSIRVSTCELYGGIGSICFDFGIPCFEWSGNDTPKCRSTKICGEVFFFPSFFSFWGYNCFTELFMFDDHFYQDTKSAGMQCIIMNHVAALGLLPWRLHHHDCMNISYLPRLVTFHFIFNVAPIFFLLQVSAQISLVHDRPSFPLHVILSVL